MKTKTTYSEKSKQMDDRTDLAQHRIEKKYGPAECDCNGDCELAFTLAGEVHHYKNLAEKEDDRDHHPYCPMITVISPGKSSLCLCAELRKADLAGDDRECLRCHSLAPDCRCAPGKEQLV